MLDTGLQAHGGGHGVDVSARGWLSQAPSQQTGGDTVQTWAIYDDRDMLDEQRTRFVHTDPDNGLMWGDYVKLCSILGIETVPKAGRNRNWRANL